MKWFIKKIPSQKERGKGELWIGADVDSESDLSVKHSYYGSALLQDWENKSIVPPTGRPTRCSDSKYQAKKRRAASIAAVTAPQLFLIIWRIADSYREQEFFNKQSSILKWMKVKMLRMNTLQLNLTRRCREVFSQSKSCQSICNLKHEFIVHP